MDIFEMRKEPHLSASGIRDFLECGLLYRFSRIDGAPPEFRSDSLEFGSTIHKVLSDFHEMKMLGEVPTIDEVTSAFEEYWRRAAEGREDIRYSKGKSFDVLLSSLDSEFVLFLAENRDSHPRLK